MRKFLLKVLVAIVKISGLSQQLDTCIMVLVGGH